MLGPELYDKCPSGAIPKPGKDAIVSVGATSKYWKPVYRVLAGVVEVFIGNAHEMRSRPGKKTEKRDAAWIAELLAHGLIRPSFVPPPDIGALRDVTRTRVALVQTRSQSKNRVHKLLEDTNLTLGSVVSALFGVTGRRMLTALVAGERDPQV
jgi:transposase